MEDGRTVHSTVIEHVRIHLPKRLPITIHLGSYSFPSLRVQHSCKLGIVHLALFAQLCLISCAYIALHTQLCYLALLTLRCLFSFAYLDQFT